MLRDGKILHVQAKPIVGPTIPDRGPVERSNAYNALLTSIQLVLDDIEFDRGDWMYLLRNEDGSDRLVYRRKPLVITKFLWAPRIDETEIEFTRWGIFGTREGFSNLKKLHDYTYSCVLSYQAGGTGGKSIYTSPLCPVVKNSSSGRVEGT